MRRNFLRGLLLCLIPTLAAAGFTAWAMYEETPAAQAAAEQRANGRVAAYQASLERLNAASAAVADLRKQGAADAQIKTAEDEEKAAKADAAAKKAESDGWRPQFRRGIDLAGGTILIYEVKDGRQLESAELRELADKLKRRIDENDMRNVVVRPLGTNRIEIILPFVGGAGGKQKANAEFVEEVRLKVRQTGVLEFRIVANSEDDRRGIDDATKLINEADGETARLVQDAAERGNPPPGPDKTDYMVKAAGEVEEPVGYVWVELAKEEREQYGLSQQYKGKGKAVKQKDGSTSVTHFYDTLEAQRGKAVAAEGGMLFLSREFKKKTPAKDEEGKAVEYFVLCRESPTDLLRVVGDVRLTARSQTGGQKGPEVHFTFTSGGNRLYELTKRNKPAGFERHMAVVMDGKIVSAPTLNATLNGAGTISGNFDVKSADRLVTILRSGNLNAELKPDPVSENTIGATLGETTIRAGLIAVAAAFGVVLVFMLIYYRFAGMVACVALFINLLMTVGFMVAMNAAFTLPGLAGLVLMLGMAVDANVLIYERLREEREKGATLAAAIRNGYDRAFLTIIDTHLTSIFTSVILYSFGTDALKGFAVSLTVGLIISLFTSLYITRLMFDFWLHKKWLTQLKMLKLFARPNFDFMKIRFAMIALTGALTVGGLALFLARGERVLNVDFTQGTAYGGRLGEGKERTLTELLDLLGEKAQKERLGVQDVQRLSGNTFRVNYADGQSTVVTLANDPEGATEEAKVQNVKERLSGLPDVSVEQVYLNTDTALPAGKSRSFTARTTEKEKEVVQVVLDRLLRVDGQPLLDTATATAAAPDGGKVRVTFTRPVAPAYFRDFVVRTMRGGVTAYAGEADKVTVVGVPNPTDDAKAAEEVRDQKFATLEVDFTKVEGLSGEAAAGEITSTVNGAVTTFGQRPVPERLETFDPSLAKDTRSKAFMAILLSWLAILAFLWFRFGSWRFGLAAVLCLIHDLCFTLGAIAVCHYLHDTVVGRALQLRDFKIDLTAVAALLTLVGYSVNEIIVNFARLREVRGKSPVLLPQMINASVNQTLSRTILTSMTVFLVSFVLYWFGGEGVHLFAFVMVMGVLISTYSSIYVASPLLLMFGEGKPKVGTGPGGTPAAGPDGDHPAETAAPVSAIAS